jgi:nucleotide-binding universal stress UspA family protein
MFERLVVPLDGSKLGEMAIPWAEEIASIFNSEISFISVSENESAEEVKTREGYLNQQIEKLAGQSSTKEGTIISSFKPVILKGEPAQEIITYTREQNSGLLTLVSHGRSGIMPWPMGSTAARILSRVDCPVLFIRAQKSVTNSSSLLQHILLALDGSEKGEAIIPNIVEIAQRISVLVTLLQVIPIERHIVTIGGESTALLPKMQIDRLRKEADEYLKSIEIRFPIGRVKSLVYQGDPAREIMEFAENRNVSLIGITTRGRTDTGEWRFGQVAYKMIHSSNTPVLIVRSTPDRR